MRLFLSLTAAALATTAAVQLNARPVLPLETSNSTPPIRMPGPPPADAQVCADRIHEVREERGLPTLQREHATPDEGLLIAAVDHRIDGCSVMVMRNDTRDVRPLPTAERPGRLERIAGG